MCLQCDPVTAQITLQDSSCLQVLFPVLASEVFRDRIRLGLHPGVWRVVAQVLSRGGAWEAVLSSHEPRLGPQSLNSADRNTLAAWEWALPLGQS